MTFFFIAVVFFQAMHFTCVSVSIKDVATSKRFGLDRYLLSLN